MDSPLEYIRTIICFIILISVLGPVKSQLDLTDGEKVRLLEIHINVYLV